MKASPPSSLSKEKRQRDAGGDDERQHPQRLQERTCFNHGWHPISEITTEEAALSKSS